MICARFSTPGEAGGAGLRIGRGQSGAADVKNAGVGLAVDLEADGHRTDERVPLIGGVLTHDLCQLVLERLGVRPEPLVVGGRKSDAELIGDEDAGRADRLAVVGLAAQRRCQLDRLHTALEYARERAFDEAAQASLESLQGAHGTSFPVRPRWYA